MNRLRLVAAIAFLAMLLPSCWAAVETCNGLDDDGDGAADNHTCGDGVCDTGIGENKTECAIDCDSYLSHLAFSDMVKLFQVRSSPSGYLPEGGVVPGIEFTIGFYGYGSLPNYCYVSVANIQNDGVVRWTASSNINDYDFVVLTKDDLDAIFANPNYIKDSMGGIRKGIIQRLDIEKFILNYSGKTYAFGVKTDALTYELLAGALQQDSDLPAYQAGETIVYSFSYGGTGLGQKPFLNFNNSDVREYAARVILKMQNRCGSNYIFMDNFLTGDSLLNTYYVSGSPDRDVRIAKNTENLFDILSRVNAHNGSSKFILNGYTRTQYARKKFVELANANPSYLALFEMLMFENVFWIDNQSILIDEHYPYAKQLFDNGKKVLFVAGDGTEFQKFGPSNPNTCVAYKVWLWTHLVGNNLSYLYINDYYNKPMINYKTYSYKLGQPVAGPEGELHKQDPTCTDDCIWSRKFERGTIIFDTSIGKLDAIKFVEDTSKACGNGACDTDIGETIAGCPADCAPIPCGNGYCDSGETFATCPGDCKCGNGNCDSGETFETCPADCPNPQECIKEPEMLGYIGQWQRGEISMLTLMQKMAQWKAGTGCA